MIILQAIRLKALLAETVLKANASLNNECSETFNQLPGKSKYRIRSDAHTWAVLALSIFFAACSDQRTSGNEESRLLKAEMLFKARCGLAGEKIKRKVNDVEGIALLKVRSTKTNYDDQFSLDDPYGNDLGGDGYIESFLNAKYEERRLRAVSSTGKSSIVSDASVGYAYVEAIAPEDQKKYLYTASLEQAWQSDPKIPKNHYKIILHKKAVQKFKARYAVTYDDISTRQDREYWIAGSSLRVIDLRTNEVIAERIGYMMDPGQGSRGSGGGRSPWLLAASNACPSFPGRHAYQIRQTNRFVEKVLIPARAAAKND